MNRKILLASKSETRKRLLQNAGIEHESMPHQVDEEDVKLSMASSPPEETVVKLAEMKALKVSMIHEDAIVIGSDQGLDFGGNLINKAKDKKEALDQLRLMNGKKHSLITVTIVAKNNSVLWKYVDRAEMNMRKLKDSQIHEYLDNVNDNILNLVGVYAIEGIGLKLFEKIGSDLFSIQGISMIQLCQFLWDNNLIFEKNVI